ncbi:MAG TPA: hypothetical protein ENJ28_01830 [Gammaproteobacteria bacterium]|nr:hypothetical protein [Gammaproteobacteria bacterium]
MGWSDITGLSSVVIAVCALALTIWQGKQIQKHNRLSVKPHLATWSHSDEDEGVYLVELINNGLGPAVITKFTLSLDGRPIEGQGTEPIEKLLKDLFQEFSYKSKQAYIAKGYAMAEKEKCVLLEMKFDEKSCITKTGIEDKFARAALTIEYESFYGEKFVLSTEDESNNKINQDPQLNAKH